MRIAFISFDFGEYCIQHANHLLAHGEVLLLIPSELSAPYVDSVDPGVEFRPFSKPRLRQPLQQWKTVRWILRQIEEFAPDVVHFQAGHLWFNFALPWLRRRYPVVLTIHDPRQHTGDRGAKNTPQWVMDYGFRRADKVIVHGSQLKRVLSDEIGILPDNVFVIPHIAFGDRERQPVETHRNEILFFGRIWRYKGLEYLVAAQPLISHACPEARIVICGRGENFDYYRNKMHDPGKFDIHNRWISDDERDEFFQRAAMVVLPYIEATQSGVVPIAYAHGKPVVATRTGGLPDVVESGKTGLLVEPKDETGLAQAIIKLLKDPELCDAMGAAGLQKLNTEFSPTVVCRQTAQVYQAAIDQRNSVLPSSPQSFHQPRLDAHEQ